VNTAAIPYLFPEDLYQLPPRPLVVVLSGEWDQYTDDQKSLLAKILGAVKLDLASVQLVTGKGLSMTYLSHLASPKILVFGASLNDVKPYEHVQAQGFSVIKADDLSELDDAKKKSLWLALRTMFGV
jgi:hypothetical protein